MRRELWAFQEHLSFRVSWVLLGTSGSASGKGPSENRGQSTICRKRLSEPVLTSAERSWEVPGCAIAGADDAGEAGMALQDIA